MPLGQALADDALTYTPLFLLLLYLAQGEVNPLQAKVLLCGSLLLVIALKVKVLLKRGLDFGLWTLNFGLLSGLFLLGLSVYLYIPLRWPALHGRSMALGEFANWVLASRFHGAFHSVPLSYEAPPAEYQIEVGLYLLSTMARLPVLDEEMRAVDDKVIIE